MSKSRFNRAMNILAEKHNSIQEKEKQALQESTNMNLNAFKRNKTPTQIAVEKRNRVKQFKLEAVSAFITSAILEGCVDKEIVDKKTEEVLVTSQTAVNKLSDEGVLDTSNMNESAFTSKLAANLNELAEYQYNLEKQLIEKDEALETLLTKNITEALEVVTNSVRESVVTLFLEHQNHIENVENIVTETKYLTAYQKTQVKRQSVLESMIQTNLGTNVTKLVESTEDADLVLNEAKFTSVIQYAFLECVNQLNLVKDFDRNAFLAVVRK
jgi:hypothetical protein